MIYDSSKTNMIVDLTYAISRPCGYLLQNYARRDFESSEYLKPDPKICEYFDPLLKSKEHNLFFSTTQFSDTEYNVYK